MRRTRLVRVQMWAVRGHGARALYSHRSTVSAARLRRLSFILYDQKCDLAIRTARRLGVSARADFRGATDSTPDEDRRHSGTHDEKEQNGRRGGQIRRAQPAGDGVGDEEARVGEGELRCVYEVAVLLRGRGKKEPR